MRFIIVGIRKRVKHLSKISKQTKRSIYVGCESFSQEKKTICLGNKLKKFCFRFEMHSKIRLASDLRCCQNKIILKCLQIFCNNFYHHNHHHPHPLQQKLQQRQHNKNNNAGKTHQIIASYLRNLAIDWICEIVNIDPVHATIVHLVTVDAVAIL